MDTMTYASLAVIPESVAESNQRPIVAEAELAPLDLPRPIASPGCAIYYASSVSALVSALGGRWPGKFDKSRDSSCPGGGREFGDPIDWEVG